MFALVLRRTKSPKSRMGILVHAANDWLAIQALINPHHILCRFLQLGTAHVETPQLCHIVAQAWSNLARVCRCSLADAAFAAVVGSTACTESGIRLIAATVHRLFASSSTERLQ